MPSDGVYDVHIFVTLDDDQQTVLGLFRSDETGYFIREDEDWVPFDDENDNGKLWDRVIIDLSDDVAEYYDNMLAKNKVVTANMVKEFEVVEGEEQ